MERDERGSCYTHVPHCSSHRIDWRIMARVTKCYCDKCGKEIAENKVYDIRYPYFDSEYNGIMTRYVELCKDCITELDLFIMGKPNKAVMRDDA